MRLFPLDKPVQVINLDHVESYSGLWCCNMKDGSDVMECEVTMTSGKKFLLRTPCAEDFIETLRAYAAESLPPRQQVTITDPEKVWGFLRSVATPAEKPSDSPATGRDDLRPDGTIAWENFVMEAWCPTCGQKFRSKGEAAAATG